MIERPNKFLLFQKIKSFKSFLKIIRNLFCCYVRFLTATVAASSVASLLGAFRAFQVNTSSIVNKISRVENKLALGSRMAGLLGFGSLSPKGKNAVVAGGLTTFVFGVYFYTMRAVGGTDELQVAIDTFEGQKSKK